jgi:sugar O-acyltransferase (sialic acid O-acetyltransferase NeuD family)
MEQAYLDKQLNSDKTEDIIPFEKLQEKFKAEDYDLFIAVGNNIVRERIFNSAKQKGYKLATYISSKASTWDNLKTGDNCFIGEGSSIQPFVKLGNNTIIMETIIGHHCTIGNNILLSVCTLGGNVKVGNGSFLGMGSVVRQNVNIADKNIIGMGSIIDKNTEPNSVYTTKTAIKRIASYDKIANIFLN